MRSKRPVSVSLSESLLARVKAASLEIEDSVSWIVTQALKQWLDAHERGRAE